MDTTSTPRGLAALGLAAGPSGSGVPSKTCYRYGTVAVSRRSHIRGISLGPWPSATVTVAQKRGRGEALIYPASASVSAKSAYQLPVVLRPRRFLGGGSSSACKRVLVPSPLPTPLAPTDGEPERWKEEYRHDAGTRCEAMRCVGAFMRLRSYSNRAPLRCGCISNGLIFARAVGVCTVKAPFPLHVAESARGIRRPRASTKPRANDESSRIFSAGALHRNAVSLRNIRSQGPPSVRASYASGTSLTPYCQHVPRCLPGALQAGTRMLVAMI